MFNSNYRHLSKIKQTSKGKKKAVVEGFDISTVDTLVIIDSDLTVDFGDSIDAIVESTKNENILVNCSMKTFSMGKDALIWANYIAIDVCNIFINFSKQAHVWFAMWNKSFLEEVF